ncbi:lipocalin family protein [Flavobacterium sp. DGU11]|uniref:Lipocalin family protein n=1 Tax=Flavobacterium arundinis TaxID=3139143 RepID=A0ABU9HUY8_9FLAO
MMKQIVLLLVFLSAISCGKVTDDSLKKLTGYWEIEKVIMPDGSTKDYGVNPTIDYFELKGKEGIRKKVMPQFDGTYLTNDVSEKISITEKEGKTFIVYATEFAKWQEEIVTLDDDELVLKNDHKMEYHYKKPEPFTVK